MKINHVLVRSSNLEAMNRFLVDVIGLKPGDRPSFPFDGSWLYSGGKQIMHVIFDIIPNKNSGAVEHIALEGGDYDKLMS